MSEKTFVGKLFRNTSLVGSMLEKKEDAANKQRNANEAGAGNATADAKAKAKLAAEETKNNQTAKQAASMSTPSKGFGQNTENLTRSFLLRL